MVNPAWEELAKLYLRIDGKVYRFKIFPKHVGIEQQPGGRHWLTVNAKRKVGLSHIW